VFVVNLKCCLNIFMIFLSKIDFVIFLGEKKIKIKIMCIGIHVSDASHVYLSTRGRHQTCVLLYTCTLVHVADSQPRGFNPLG
jgi:hypothetical protein